jgi:hypothetical protein
MWCYELSELPRVHRVFSFMLMFHQVEAVFFAVPEKSFSLFRFLLVIQSVPIISVA